MNPREKRFIAKYLPMADAIGRLDIPQTIREDVAAALTAAIADTHVHTDFDAKAFRLLASDPLVACCGTDDGPCSRGIEIRVGMHLSTAPDGRAQSWQEDRPVVRCVWCDLAMRVKS